MELKEGILLKDLKIYYVNHSLDIATEMEPRVFYIYFFTIGLLIIFSFSLVFNIISISSIISARAFSPINLLILNLGIADIVYSLGMPLFLSQMYSKNWEFGLIGCRIFIFTDFIGIIVSVLTVSALSVERFFDVTDTKKIMRFYNRKSRKITVCVYLGLVWVIAMCFSVPMIASIRLHKYGSSISCTSTWSDMKMKSFFLIKFIFIFLIPYMIIIVSSLKLLIFLNRWKTQAKYNRIRLRNHKISFDYGKSNSVAISNKTSVFSCSLSYNRNVIDENKEFIPGKSLTLAIKQLPNNYLKNGLYKNSIISKSVPVIQDKNDATFKKSVDGLKKYKSFYFNINPEIKPSLPIDNLERLKSLYCAENNIQSADQMAEIEEPSSANNWASQFLKNLNYLFGLNECFGKKKFFNERTYNVNSIRIKASRLVLIIILLFLIQWSPLWMFQLLMLFTKKEFYHVQLINLIITTLSYSNTVANPALYMLITYNFREYCKKSSILKRVRKSVFFNNL